MEYISTTQLRENFGRLKDGLAAGESYTLIHRSQPIAQIEPYSQPAPHFQDNKDEEKQIQQNLDKLEELRSRAAKLDFKVDYTPDELNRMYDEEVYQTYD